MAEAHGPAYPEWYRPPAPYEPGNEAALRHGAYSPRYVDPLAQELVAGVLAAAADPSSRDGYLAASSFRPALWAWARAEAQVQLLTEYLAKAGEASGDGLGDLSDERVTTAQLLLHRAEARALSGRTRLGLDPASRARLGRDVAEGQAADAARIMAELEAAEKARGDGA